MEARTRLGMRPEAPGPIPDPNVRRDLTARFGPLLDAGIGNLQKTLELNPQYTDAMSYMNLIIRERADLRDTAGEWRRDTAEADQWVQKALDTKKLRAQQSPAVVPAGGFGGIRVGPAIQEQKLIHRVDPVYPPFAAQARIQGIVRLNIMISKEGSVNNASVISGHPLLVPAAVDAVKQWLYQPTQLNGNPVEVMTEVTVPFNLDPSVIVK
jgi:TonB family protein